jgi:hypothetical protein
MRVSSPSTSGELVPAVAEPVALVDEVLVDVDPRRRVDRLGEPGWNVTSGPI